jgi:hypothetical protein
MLVVVHVRIAHPHCGVLVNLCTFAEVVLMVLVNDVEMMRQCR